MRDYSGDFENDLFNIFSKVDLKHVLLIVFANIFFSYGMLYVANYFVVSFPSLDFLVNFTVPSMSLVSFAPLISTVVISPIAEELIFRGVLLNRLKIYVPTIFAVLISALLFGSLHNFGSITSAVVFAICMAIMYLKTENICVPILAHFLNNFFAEIIRIIDVNELLFTDVSVMLIIGILAIVSAIILLSSIVKELKKLNNK
ncbi:MAG: CPBP family intramembrane metalloprotease [Methanobrevibacter sp.]|nr:CPBP family intramembrane metalloprotease [Methanobrevibacter sp.]